MSFVFLSPILKPTADTMEFYLVAFCSSLPFPLSEKVTESPMQAALTDGQSHTPRDWRCLVHQNDPDRQYIVTAVSHYKERSPWPDCQHEYLLLFVQLRPHPHQSTSAPVTSVLKVSRTIVGHALPARLGLWGPTRDTISTNHQLPRDGSAERLHHLVWAPNDAPHLHDISVLIYQVHILMPQYRLLQSSCCAFARVVGRVIYRIFDGVQAGVPQSTPFLIRESYLLHCIPAGIARAESVAAAVVETYYNFRGLMSEDELEGSFISLLLDHFSQVFHLVS